MTVKTAAISTLVDEKAVPSFESWKSQFYITFIFWFSNSILVYNSSTWWNKMWTIKWIWEFRQSKSGFLSIEKKVLFSMEMELSFWIENLGTYFSIFHNSRNWASFSLHFWITKRILQPLITYGIITIIKVKTTLCV